MGTVRAQLSIDAPPEAVWAVLSDIAGWSDWNDVIVGGRCDGGEGSRVSCSVAVMGPIWFPVRSRAHTWTDNETLVWGENLGRILRINHGFVLRPDGEGTHVEHYESFEGAIGRLVYPLVRRSLTRNYTTFLESLKTRVETAS